MKEMLTRELMTFTPRSPSLSTLAAALGVAILALPTLLWTPQLWPQPSSPF